MNWRRSAPEYRRERLEGDDAVEDAGDAGLRARASSILTAPMARSCSTGRRDDACNPNRSVSGVATAAVAHAPLAAATCSGANRSAEQEDNKEPSASVEAIMMRRRTDFGETVRTEAEARRVLRLDRDRRRVNSSSRG